MTSRSNDLCSAGPSPAVEVEEIELSINDNGEISPQTNIKKNQ